MIEALESRRLLSHGVGGPHKGVRSPTDSDSLTAADVQTIIGQAASQALPGQAIVVSDREGIILGIWGGRGLDDNRVTELETGEIIAVPGEAKKVIETATSRARTAAFFSSNENAFTTRTARFIVQDHFPFPIKGTPGGPLYGVQFSSFRGSDQLSAAQTNFPTISGDPGGVPIYKNGISVGGIGVAGDGRDVATRPELLPIQIAGSNPEQLTFSGTEEKDVDEAVALAGVKGYKTPKRIAATKIFVDGLRFPFTRDKPAKKNPTRTLSDLIAAGAGSLRTNEYLQVTDPSIKASTPPAFLAATIGGVPGFLKRVNAFDELSQTLVPVGNTLAEQIVDSNDKDGNGVLLSDGQRLTAADVMTILSNAVAQANNTRALIREPNGVPAKVHVSVVDRDGDLLGVFRMIDAPNFGYDVSFQKARTAAFFSDDSHAFTPRAIGFLSQQFFPIGIEGGTVPGPLFNVQDRDFLPGVTEGTALNLAPVVNGEKNPLMNGINIFPGGAPLYKNGVLVGGIGISGDGVDQDEVIAYAGTRGFRPALEIRADALGAEEVATFIVGRLTRMTQLFNLGFLPATSLTGLDKPVTEADVIAAAIARFREGFKDLRLPYLRLPRNAAID